MNTEPIVNKGVDTEGLLDKPAQPSPAPSTPEPGKVPAADSDPAPSTPPTSADPASPPSPPAPASPTPQPQQTFTLEQVMQLMQTVNYQPQTPQTPTPKEPLLKPEDIDTIIAGGADAVKVFENFAEKVAAIAEGRVKPQIEPIAEQYKRHQRAEAKAEFGKVYTDLAEPAVLDLAENVASHLISSGAQFVSRQHFFETVAHTTRALVKGVAPKTPTPTAPEAGKTPPPPVSTPAPRKAPSTLTPEEQEMRELAGD